MFDHDPGFFQGTDTCPALDQVAAFLDTHGDSLVNAAEILGGPAAWPRCQRLRERVRRAERLDQPIRRELGALHRVLTLADVGDPEHDESAFFAAIDPADPVVEEICLLADALDNLLDELDVVSAPSTLAHAHPSAA